MSNVFLNLPAPAGNGSGAWIDCAALGSDRTIVVGGGTLGTVNIEISNEAVATKAAPIASFTGKGQTTISAAAKWMRATVVGYKSGGAPNINVGGNDDGTTLLNLVPPANNGAGAAADSSALPLTKTVTVGGPFRGTVILEYSEDLGITWGTWCIFTTPGTVTKTFAAERMRVVRSGIVSGAAPGAPLVNIGAADGGSGGGGSGFGAPQIVRYVAVGGEEDFMVPFAVPRPTDLYDVFPANQGVANIVGFDNPDTLAGDRTASAFRTITTGALTAGDVLSFVVANR